MTDAEIAQRFRDQAYDSAEGAATAASDAEAAIGDVIAEARELRKKITSGVVAPDDARRARRSSRTAKPCADSIGAACIINARTSRARPCHRLTMSGVV